MGKGYLGIGLVSITILLSSCVSTQTQVKETKSPEVKVEVKSTTPKEDVKPETITTVAPPAETVAPTEAAPAAPEVAAPTEAAPAAPIVPAPVAPEAAAPTEAAPAAPEVAAPTEAAPAASEAVAPVEPTPAAPEASVGEKKAEALPAGKESKALHQCTTCNKEVGEGHALSNTGPVGVIVGAAIGALRSLKKTTKGELIKKLTPLQYKVTQEKGKIGRAHV